MRSDAESPDPGADGDGTATFEPADLPDDPQLAVEELIADADVDLEELASNVDDLVYVAELTPAEAAESAATEVDPHAVIGGPAFAEDRIAAKTWALFLGLALVMIGNGLQGAVLGLRSEAEGFGVGVTGLVMTAYFCGFLVGSRYAEHAVQTVGHIRTFSALASTASATALVHVLIVEPIAWGLMRFVFGLCMAGLYVVIESWLNDLGTNATRGRLLAIYMLVTMAGITIGQFMINLAESTEFTLFAVSSVAVSVSLVPIALSAAAAPSAKEPKRVRVRQLVEWAPTGVVCSFLSGAGLGALVGLSAVYAAATDMTPQRISFFLAAPMIGSIVFQWPVGAVSDRVPRRGVIVTMALLSAGCGLALFMVPTGSWAAVGVMFVLGGVAFPLYSLAIAVTIDWIPEGTLVGATAALVRINGAGAIAGPLAVAGLMAVDRDLFFAVQVVPYLAIAGYTLYRIFVRDAVPLDEQVPYQAIPARASASVARLLPRQRRR